MSKESWVGFPDVADRTGGDITIGYTGLPVGLDLESLQLNTRPLQLSLIKATGYEAAILSAYQGDTDQYAYGVSGLDGSGLAQATGAIAASKAESSQISSDPSELNKYHIRSGVLGLHWNISALNDRITLADQYNPEVRAQQLQKVIRSAAMQTAVRHNVTEIIAARSTVDMAASAGIDMATNLSMIFSIADSNLLLLSSTIFADSFYRAFRTVGPMLRAGKTSKDILSDPLFYSIRPLRAAAAVGVLASHRLVRATPTKNYQ